MTVQMIVTAILLLNPKVPMHRAVKIASLLAIHCHKALHPYALAIMAVESNFDPNAYSDTSDVGYFQLHSKYFPLQPLLANPDKNIELGCGVLFETWMLYSASHPADWYGFYHSKTPSHRHKYVVKVRSNLDKIKELYGIQTIIHPSKQANTSDRKYLHSGSTCCSSQCESSKTRNSRKSSRAYRRDSQSS